MNAAHKPVTFAEKSKETNPNEARGRNEGQRRNATIRNRKSVRLIFKNSGKKAASLKE